MQTQQIVHLFNDDKFIDLTIDLFETTFPTKSVYYILKKKGEKLNFVKSYIRLSLEILINFNIFAKIVK